MSVPFDEYDGCLLGGEDDDFFTHVIIVIS